MYPCIHIARFLIRAKVDRAGRGRPEKGPRLPTKWPFLHPQRSIAGRGAALFESEHWM